MLYRLLAITLRIGQSGQVQQAPGLGFSIRLQFENLAEQAVARLETLIMMNKLEMPLIAIRSQVASAIQIILQASRLSDGTRKITHISELVGLDEHGNYDLHDIFICEILGIDEQGNLKTQHIPTGYRPTFIEEATRQGIKVPESLFMRPSP